MAAQDLIFKKISEALLVDYSSVYYVNAITNEYYWYSVNPEFHSLSLEQGGDDFFKNIIRDCKKVIYKEDGFFYSFKYGYIMSDNGSNGNDPVKKWRVYDGDFNPVMSGTGNAYMTQDEVTGEVYLYSIEDGKMTVYSLTEGEELFSLDNFCYNLRAYDGRFYGFAKNRFFLADDSGSVLFDYEVDHRTIRGI